jgi:hypothetical protein
MSACGQFADVLDGTAVYYGDFADALETYAQPDYRDPAVATSNLTGRTALRQGAGVTMSAANTPQRDGERDEQRCSRGTRGVRLGGHSCVRRLDERR